MRQRVAPMNVEAEESLLGAMMLNRDAIATAVEMHVTVDDFAKKQHAAVFTAILDLSSEGESVDPVTVAERLRQVDLLDALGGKVALLRIQAATPASANATEYATIVKDCALRNRLIQVGAAIAELGYDADDEVAKSVDTAERMLFDVTNQRLSNRTLTLGDSIQQTMDNLDEIDRGHDVGIPTGFRELDGLLFGLPRSALVLLAARPAMGKTALALNIAANVALRDRPVLFFSLEMSHLELTKRLLAAQSSVKARRFWDAKLTMDDWDHVNAAVGRLTPAPFLLDDDPQPSLLEIRAKARRTKTRHGDLGLIVVDYIQLMRTPGETRQLEVDEIARSLKVLARELDVPVLALAQLNRQVEYRTDKRPMLADLRDSGALEQHADIVTFIYRDEIYNPESDDRGTAEIIVAKHRNGPTGTVRLVFLDHLTKFVDLTRGPA
jgi:replicative DNA helicase